MQYAAEIFFPVNLLAHVQRTLRPDHATLFIVPAFLGLSARGACGNDTQNLLDTQRIMRRPSVRRWSHRRHVIVNTDYKSAASVRLLHALLPNLCHGAQLSFRYAARQFRADVARSLAVPLVALPVPLTLPPWHARNTTLFFGGQTHGASTSYMPRRRLVKYSAGFTVPAIVYSTSTWVHRSDVCSGKASTSNPCYMVQCKAHTVPALAVHCIRVRFSPWRAICGLHRSRARRRRASRLV